MNTKIYTIILITSLILWSCTLSSDKTESKNTPSIGWTQDVTENSGSSPQTEYNPRN